MSSSNSHEIISYRFYNLESSGFQSGIHGIHLRKQWCCIDLDFVLLSASSCRLPSCSRIYAIAFSGCNFRCPHPARLVGLSILNSNSIFVEILKKVGVGMWVGTDSFHWIENYYNAICGFSKILVAPLIESQNIWVEFTFSALKILRHPLVELIGNT